MANFLKNPVVRMPTYEEHRATSLKWLAHNRATLVDQWPEAVAALSIPTKFVRVPDGLYDEFCSLHDGAKPGPVMNALADELDRELGWERKFVRLNSRSPKDMSWPFEVPITLSGKEALSMMSCSERVLDDLQEFSYLPEQPAYICLRDIVYGLTASREFRCFVRDGQIGGVTHYDYRNPIKPPEDGGKELRAQIDAWFESKLKPALHLETVVFDVFQQGSGKFLLIELNPWGTCDPCFFGSYENLRQASSYIQFAFPDETAKS